MKFVAGALSPAFALHAGGMMGRIKRNGHAKRSGGRVSFRARSDAERAASDDTQSFLSQTSKLIALATASVGMIVASFGVVSSYRSEALSQHVSFRQAVKAEEDYWILISNQYVGSFASGLDSADRDRRIAAIKIHADHSLPTFEEFGMVGAGERTLAVNMLKDRKKNFELLMNDKRVTPENLVNAAQEEEFAVSDVAGERPESRNGTQPPARSGMQPSPVSSLSFTYRTQILATGAFTGWDVDVFWCEGPEPVERFRGAASVAQALARRSERGGNIASAVTLGRIRLRYMPANQAVERGVQVGGLAVGYDNTHGTRQAAEAVLKELNGTRSGFALRHSAEQTRWLIPVYVCG